MGVVEGIMEKNMKTFEVSGLGFEVEGLGPRVWGLGFRA